MNGCIARKARRLYRETQVVAQFPTKPQHHNIRQKATLRATGVLYPATGLPEMAVFSFTTSTVVIPARRFYRSIKRDFNPSTTNHSKGK